MEHPTLAARVQHARELRGLSREELSLLAKLAKAHVSLIERGERTRLAAETLHSLARSLKVRATWLLSGTGPMELSAEEAAELALSEATAANDNANPDASKGAA